MKVAVTGGSGVVGRAVVRHLVEDGHEVRGLARSAAAAAALVNLGAVPINGDILDTDSLDDLVRDCEVVFHVAGVNELCSRDPDRMWRANVSGSVNIVEASARARARRLVHTSSAVTIGEEAGAIGSETSRHRGHFLSEYERSKTVSERLVLQSASNLEVVSVNPSSVQGPGRATGTGALFLGLARGAPVAVDTTVSLVDIDDCARGHLLAAERGGPGERYLLSGAVLTIREAVRLINDVLGRRRRPWFIRPEIVTGAAPLVENVAGLLGMTPPICAESARVLLQGHRYDGSRASRELGLEYTTVEETLARSVDWFRREGLLA
jgi:dihydroflavonol-4-reductase